MSFLTLSEIIEAIWPPIQTLSLFYGNCSKLGTRKIVSMQGSRNQLNMDLNTGRLSSDGMQSAEREFRSLAVRGKSWFGKSSLTPGNINSILVKVPWKLC